MVNAVEMRPGRGDVSSRYPGASAAPGLAPTVLSMLQSARRGLAEAADESAPGARYVTAHLAALRERVARALNVIAFQTLCQAKAAQAQGRKDESLSLLTTAALRIDEALLRFPKNAMYLGNRAYLHFLIGDRTRAREFMEEAIRIGGATLRDAELADADINPLPEDEDFKAMVRSIPLPQE